MTFKTFILGLLLLILAPLSVIGGFILYTNTINNQPQTGLLHCQVTPQIHWFTGKPADYSITFKGDLIPKPTNQFKPLDMIFVVDISESMEDTLPQMIQAARTVAQELAQNETEITNFALISFNTNATIEVPWTSDINIFETGLNKLTTGGLTDGLASIPSIKQLLTQARPDTNKVVVFYTDGLLDHIHEMANEAELLRNQQKAQLYTIITPLSDGVSNMTMVMDDPTHVLIPKDVNDLTAKFRTVADQVTGIYGYGAHLLHYIDGRNFSTPLEKDSPWRVDNNAKALQRHIGYLPYRSVTYKHAVIPKSTGLWEIGLKPPQLNFLDEQNQAQSIHSSRQPRLLVLSWWFLLLAFLPAFFWILRGINYRLKIGRIPEIQYLPPSIPSPLPPSPLPLPKPLTRQRKKAVPTLFIGIGGIGRNALYATQEVLKAAHLGNADQPYHFIWLDLDAYEKDEAQVPVWNAFPIEKIIAPPAIRQIEIPQSSEAHLKWFNAQKYFNSSREELNLVHGTQGQRDLARLALFQWQKTDAFLATLEQVYQKLLAFDSIDGTRQIILFANRTGGVGSGWLIDIARLLRRLARQEQKNPQDFIPEILGVLCATEFPEKQEQQNQQALDMELETAQLTGAFPQLSNTEAPFNWLFSITERDSTQITTQCAEFSAVLVERQPRQALFKSFHNPITSLPKGDISAVHINSLHVLPDLDWKLVKSEILLRILGKDVLLDLQRNPAGQLASPSFSEAQATELLEQWIKREPKGTPWQRLLQATQSLKADSQFLELIAEDRMPTLEWFQQAFTASLNRQLWGGHDTSKRWVREWLPGQTIAALRLLTRRLDESVKEQVQIHDLEGKFVNIIDKIISLATSAADQLQTWLEEFAPLCEAIWEERQALETQRTQKSATQQNQQLIGVSSNDKQIAQWAEQAMQEWLNQVDTTSVNVISALCERFFLVAQLEKGGIQILLSTYIGEQKQAFTHAKQAVVAIDDYAKQIAQLVPTLTVEGTLAPLADKPRQQLAKHLVNSQHVADHVLVIMPTVTDRQEQETLDAFIKQIIEPTHNLQRIDCFGDDHAAIRRVELKNETPRSNLSPTELTFIQEAEQTAEQIRQKAQALFKKQIPAFPAALRIAFSHPNAFRSFAKAYKAGHIVKREDHTGATQWFLVAQGEFLTFGKDASLAAAAANYVYYIPNPPETFDITDAPGDFTQLAKWHKKGSIPDNEDLLVLIALKMFG